MRRVLIVAVGIAAVTMVAAAGSSAVAAPRAGAVRSLPKLATGAPPGYGPRYAVRPHTIWYTGDSTAILGRIAKTVPAVGKRPGFLHWQTWTRRRAYGVGADWIKNCVPDCATSRFYRNPVTVTLTEPRDGHFVKMTLQDSIEGKQYVATWCNYTGYTYWVLPPKPGGHDCPGPHVL